MATKIDNSYLEIVQSTYHLSREPEKQDSYRLSIQFYFPDRMGLYAPDRTRNFFFTRERVPAAGTELIDMYSQNGNATFNSENALDTLFTKADAVGIQTVLEQTTERLKRKPLIQALDLHQLSLRKSRVTKLLEYLDLAYNGDKKSTLLVLDLHNPPPSRGYLSLPNDLADSGPIQKCEQAFCDFLAQTPSQKHPRSLSQTILATLKQ